MADDQSNSSPLLSAGMKLRDRWEILKKIGGGGFGEIFKAIDRSTGKVCAVKVESCVSPKQVLKMEVAVLKRLQGTTSHVCHFIGCGRNDLVNYVVMSLLGPSLSELRKKQPHQHFTLSSMLRIGVQIVDAVRAIHDCGFLHRDIKPSNFAIGATASSSRTCVMLDYGLSRQYTTLTGEVRQPRPVAGFRGTVRYASVNAHQSKDLGRHDDMWSVFYMLVELAVGQLPWRRIRDKEEAGEFKAQYDHLKLIKGLPTEFETFLDHLNSLSYFDKPEYSLVTNLLTSAMKHHGVHQSDPFDWEQDYSAPSVTSASVASPPAIQTAERRSEDKVAEKKASSKTNCSDVEDLEVNEPQSEHAQSPRDPVPVIVLEPVVESPHNSIVGGPDLNRVLSECVDVENKYESEEESVSSEQGEDQGLPQVPVNNRVNSIIVAEELNGISPMKSFQTDSLNRFFDLAPAPNKASNNLPHYSQQDSGPISSPKSDAPVLNHVTNSLQSEGPLYQGVHPEDQPQVVQYNTVEKDSLETSDVCHDINVLNIEDSCSEESHGVHEIAIIRTSSKSTPDQSPTNNHPVEINEPITKQSRTQKVEVPSTDQVPPEVHGTKLLVTPPSNKTSRDSKTLVDSPTKGSSPGTHPHTSHETTPPQFNPLVVGRKISLTETRVRVLPTPPTRPPPLNYQSYMSARRRRFVRPNGS